MVHRYLSRNNNHNMNINNNICHNVLTSRRTDLDKKNQPSQQLQQYAFASVFLIETGGTKEIHIYLEQNAKNSPAMCSLKGLLLQCTVFARVIADPFELKSAGPHILRRKSKSCLLCIVKCIILDWVQEVWLFLPLTQQQQLLMVTVPTRLVCLVVCREKTILNWSKKADAQVLDRQTEYFLFHPAVPKEAILEGLPGVQPSLPSSTGPALLRAV